MLGSPSQSTTVAVLNGIQMTQSTYGNAMPLVYGQTRIPGTLGWYGNFVATAAPNQGGKGGGNSGPSSYNYTASFVLMLCEGQVNGVATTYADKAQHVGSFALSDFGFTFFSGAAGQATWAYLTTNFPTQAIGYSSTAYVAAQNFQLGSSGSMPNLTFEVQGLLWSALSAPYKTPTGTGTFAGTTTQGSNQVTGIGSITGAGLAAGATLTGGGLGLPTVPPLATIVSLVGATAQISVLAGPGAGTGTIGYTAAGGDLDPASILVDYCTAPTHSCDFYYLDPVSVPGLTGAFSGTTVNGQPGVTFAAAAGTFPATTLVNSNLLTGIGTVTGTFAGLSSVCPGMAVTGTGIPAGTTVSQFFSGATGTVALLSNPATASGSITVSYAASAPDPRALPAGTALVQATAFPGGTSTTTSAANAASVVTAGNASASGTFAFTFSVSSWQAYCVAQGFYLSVSETTQRTAQDFITELMTITNSDCIWSGGSLKIIPLADSPVTGGGFTYTPSNGGGGAFTTPLFNFTDDDYHYDSSEDPVVVTRKGVADTHNKVRVEFLDRGNEYNTAVAEAFDVNDIAINGERPMDVVTLHNICDATVARRTAQYILQRQLYYKNSYQFKLRGDYCLLEPMDVVSLTDTVLGLNDTLVRIDSVEIDETDLLTVDCTELPFGPGNTPLYNYQFGSRTGINTNVAPPSVETPIIFTAPPLLVGPTGGFEIWIAVAGAGGGANWGGAAVYMSTDNVSYAVVGNVIAPATFGTVTSSIGAVADPDTTSTLQVTLDPGSSGVLNTSVSHADADNNRTLMLLWGNTAQPTTADTEIVAYGAAALVSAGVYNLTYLRRGLYATTDQAFASGSAGFAKLDQDIFRVPFDPGMAGQTVYFKFCSLNQYQMNLQSLASATAYSYAIPNATLLNQMLPTSWSVVGPYSAIGGTIAKSVTGATSWTDGYAVTMQAYMHGCALGFQCNSLYPTAATGLYMVGITTNPTADFHQLNFAFHCANGSYWAIYELGTPQFTTASPPAIGDVPAIIWDGNIVRYYLNGALLRAVKWSNTAPVFGQVSIQQPGSSVDHVDYQLVTTQQVQDGNFLNTWPWKIGTTGTQGNYADTSVPSAAKIVLGGTGGDPLGPYGNSEVLWKN